MNRPESERLARLEERQLAMNKRLDDNFATLFDLLNPLTDTVAKHDESIKWLSWGFRLCAAAVVTGIGGIFFKLFASG